MPESHSDNQPPPPGGDSHEASGGMRALGVLIALALAFAAAVMIMVGVEISGVPTCEEFYADATSTADECFDASAERKAASVALAWASGLVGLLAVVAGLAFAVTGTRARLLAKLAGAAVALGALSVLIGSI